VYLLRVEFEYADLRPRVALYNPSLDEGRQDGLGTGNMHRVGGGFKPTWGVVAKGRPRRARSLSPTKRGVGGRGRGNINGASLGVRMGTRPTAERVPPRFTPHHRIGNDPSMRHVRPQVNIRAKDDMVAPTSPDRSSGKVGQYVDLLGAEVGRECLLILCSWWGNRLCVNSDKHDFFQQGVIATPVDSHEAFGHTPVPHVVPHISAAPTENKTTAGASDVFRHASGLEASRHAPAYLAGPHISSATDKRTTVGASGFFRSAGGLEASRHAPEVAAFAQKGRKQASPATGISNLTGGLETSRYAPIGVRAAVFAPNVSRAANGLEASSYASIGPPPPPKSVTPKALPEYAPTGPKAMWASLSSPVPRPPDKDDWVKPPPPAGSPKTPTPEERRRAQLLAGMSYPSPNANPASSTPPGALPTSFAPLLKTTPAIEEATEIIEERRTKIEFLQEEYNSTYTLFNIYSDELENVQKEEKRILTKLQDIQVSKSEKQKRLHKQQQLMDRIATELAFLGSSSSEAIKQIVGVLSRTFFHMLFCDG